MKLCKDAPLDSFFESIGRRSIKTLSIASPFISSCGVEIIKDWIKTRKNTQVKLLTNLSEFNLILSLRDPVRPLQILKKSLGKRLEIRALSNLHAKVFLADEKHGLSGSSNLTQGGAVTNRELNWLLTDHTKQNKGHLLELSTWFNDAWLISPGCSDAELADLQEIWQRNKGSLYKHLGNSVPEPWLAGDHWQKIKEITRRKTLSKKEALGILMRQDRDKGATPEYDEKSSPHNTAGKLTFLKNAGLVRVEGETVKSLGAIKEKGQMVKVLKEHLPGFKDVLEIFKKYSELTYPQIAGILSVDNDDHYMRAAVNWMIDLGLVKREVGSGFNIFRSTGAIS